MPKSVMGARVPPMFEVGQRYTIHWMAPDGHTTSGFTVAAWEAPLLKVMQGERETIFNTASASFIMAEPSQHSGEARVNMIDIDSLLSSDDKRL